MKLFRHGPAGQEGPGIVGPQDALRDLSGHCPDITASTLSAVLATCRALDPNQLPEIPLGTRIGACIGGVSKVVGVGMNYHDHVAQAKVPLPKSPVLFMKPPTTLVGPNDDIVVPLGSAESDWEVELGVVIGALARNVQQADAFRHIAGYCTLNDITERGWARESGQLLNGKSADTFTPVGPYLVTADEVPEPQRLGMFLDLNGARYQTGNTENMIFKIDFLIGHISRFMTLLPGDIIATGTPAGVGARATPPRLLRAGDSLRLGVAGLGEQHARVVASVISA